MTDKQNIASTRNWAKARLIGSRYLLQQTYLTEEEKLIGTKIGQLVDKLLKDWDKNSQKLGFNIGPRYDVYYQGTLFREGLTSREVKVFRDATNEGYVITKQEKDG